MPRHPSQPGFPPLGPCDNPPGRSMFLVVKLTLMVMSVMSRAGGQEPFCASVALGDGCLDRIPNGPHSDIPGCGPFGRGLQLRESPKGSGCGF